MNVTIKDIGNSCELQLENCSPLFELICNFEPGTIATALDKAIKKSNTSKDKITDEQLVILSSLKKAFTELKATPILILELE